MIAYCDMATSGGGWTLIVSNPGPHTAWNASNVQQLNPSNPSISTPYSIFDVTNGVKANLLGKLNYRIDAQSLARLGGVWEAPYSASLQSTAEQNVASLITQYDSRTLDSDPYDAGGTQALSTVVPWLSGTYGIVTWGGVGNWWGSTATWQGGWNTAPYINGPMSTLSVIWYRVK